MASNYPARNNPAMLAGYSSGTRVPLSEWNSPTAGWTGPEFPLELAAQVEQLRQYMAADPRYKTKMYDQVFLDKVINHMKTGIDPRDALGAADMEQIVPKAGAGAFANEAEYWAAVNDTIPKILSAGITADPAEARDLASEWLSGPGDRTSIAAAQPYSAPPAFDYGQYYAQGISPENPNTWGPGRRLIWDRDYSQFMPQAMGTRGVPQSMGIEEMAGYGITPRAPAIEPTTSVPDMTSPIFNPPASTAGLVRDPTGGSWVRPEMLEPSISAGYPNEGFYPGMGPGSEFFWYQGMPKPANPTPFQLQKQFEWEVTLPSAPSGGGWGAETDRASWEYLPFAAQIRASMPPGLPLDYQGTVGNRAAEFILEGVEPGQAVDNASELAVDSPFHPGITGDQILASKGNAWNPPQYSAPPTYTPPAYSPSAYQGTAYSPQAYAVPPPYNAQMAPGTSYMPMNPPGISSNVEYGPGYTAYPKTEARPQSSIPGYISNPATALVAASQAGQLPVKRPFAPGQGMAMPSMSSPQLNIFDLIRNQRR